jgi:uncharacterized membrane protein YhaH (DUF805 family)
MDNIVGLFTSTTGRISRKSWWLGVVIIIVLNLIITFLILPMVGLSGPSAQAIMDAAQDPTKLAAVMSSGMQAAGWGSLVLFVIFAYPQYALGVKRRHDKDNNGIDVLIFLALEAVLFLVQALGLGYTIGDAGGMAVPVPSMIYSILGLVFLVYAIYMLVVLGFLRGTAGPNQYGPDPLGGTATATA